MSASLRELIDGTTELASLPVTTIRLMELLEDPAAAVDRVLRIIEKDPALTANLLKLCNSAYYGMRRRIGSPREALILLGNKTVIMLALATSMGDVLRGQLTAYRLGKEKMWHHSLATAVAAARAPRPTSSPPTESPTSSAMILLPPSPGCC